MWQPLPFYLFNSHKNNNNNNNRNDGSKEALCALPASSVSDFSLSRLQKPKDCGGF
jgi:hypothetical protein